MNLTITIRSRIVQLGLMASLCLVLGFADWWLSSDIRRCEGMRYAGLERLEPAILEQLAEGLDKPDVVADRVRRHPWVRSVQVACRWDGNMLIRIVERSPVLRAMPDGDHWGYYLDAHGFRMPVTYAIDVPLVRGQDVEPYHPLRSISSTLVRELAQSLSQTDMRTDALLSTFVLDGDQVRLQTTAAGPFESIEVRLGRERIGERMEVLTAFWFQAMLQQPDVGYIDLRFQGQVVTRSAAGLDPEHAVL